jgi:hypothetical protein
MRINHIPYKQNIAHAWTCKGEINRKNVVYKMCNAIEDQNWTFILDSVMINFADQTLSI